MTYSVEDWTTISRDGNLTILHSNFAVVDLDRPVLNMTGETEHEIICLCPQEKHAVRLVHLLNRAS